MIREIKAFLLVGLLLLATGCASTIKHSPLAEADYYQVDFNQLAPERWWGDTVPADLELGYRQSIKGLMARYADDIAADPDFVPTSDALVLSGGSADGAFGVGILAGWTESGTRPEFDYVTGISTGAMIAPLAFLGSDYDQMLAEAYTSISRDNIFRSLGLSGLLWGSAFADTKPLSELLEQYITEDVVRAIAAEQKRGRSLIIQTTQFDALRPTVWNITAIAANRGAEATPLIRRIILASAAVPGMFPPVTLEWESNGQRFTELHVDGAVTSQVFAYPAQIRVAELDKAMGVKVKRRMYVIQNSNAVSFYDRAPVNTIPIMRRALSGLLLSQLNRDVERIYYLTQRDGIEFNMIAIPDTFKADRSNEFDRNYMIKLFELGRGIAQSGEFWQPLPRSER